MSPTELVIFALRYINLTVALVIALASVFAFVEAARATGYAYESAFKRTKGFWVAVTGAAAVFSVISVVYGSGSLFLQLIAATAVGVFLADVRPAVTVRRRR